MALILGSSSIFRQNQLKQLGLKFECFSPDIDEDTIKNSDHTPFEIAKILSENKARAVLEKFPKDIVIGADQVLNLNGEIFSKPGTPENAVKQLLKLSGKTHELITGYCIISKDRIISDCIVSKMTIKKLTQKQIENYVSIDSPLHSCGSYKLETMGISLFEKIECPDHSAIIGLPLIELTKSLEAFGIDVI